MNIAIQAAPIGGASAKYPVDWKALVESSDGDGDGDEGFLRDLVNAYIETGDRELAAIAAALSAGDPAAMLASVHTLKGASANLHASAATSAAAQLEAAIKLGENGNIPPLAEKLTWELRQTVAYLQSMVSIGGIRGPDTAKTQGMCG